jgi:monoamine oxidase
VHYGARFWLEQNWHGNLSTDLPITCVWNATRQTTKDGGLLTVYTGATHGATFTALNDATRMAEALAQVEQAFPGGGRWVRAARTIAWANEPLTQGGYVFFKPGTVMEHWERLRAPMGRVHVAGEHTAVHQGYMEGAVESGQRAAREIMARV